MWVVWTDFLLAIQASNRASNLSQRPLLATHLRYRVGLRAMWWVRLAVRMSLCGPPTVSPARCTRVLWGVSQDPPVCPHSQEIKPPAPCCAVLLLWCCDDVDLTCTRSSYWTLMLLFPTHPSTAALWRLQREDRPEHVHLRT